MQAKRDIFVGMHGSNITKSLRKLPHGSFLVFIFNEEGAHAQRTLRYLKLYSMVGNFLKRMAMAVAQRMVVSLRVLGDWLGR